MRCLFLTLLFISLLSCSRDDAPTPNNQAPVAFKLLAVGNNATGVILQPSLNWEVATDPDGDAVTYRVYLDQNSNPSTEIKSGLTTTNFTLTTALANNTAYYWKVVATDAKGATTSSNTFKFTTQPAGASNHGSRKKYGEKS